MPLLLKAKLGDLIELIDTKTDDVIRIEIDSTGKNVTRLCFDAPQNIRIERVKLKDRKADREENPFDYEQTPRTDAPESESPRDE